MTGIRADVEAAVVVPDPPVGSDGQPLAAWSWPDRFIDELDVALAKDVRLVVDAIPRIWPAGAVVLAPILAASREAVEALAWHRGGLLLEVRPGLSAEDLTSAIAYADELHAVALIPDGAAMVGTVLAVHRGPSVLVLG